MDFAELMDSIDELEPSAIELRTSEHDSNDTGKTKWAFLFGDVLDDPFWLLSS
jgi:hypothetical protein